jgi:hypothetical protein
MTTAVGFSTDGFLLLYAGMLLSNSYFFLADVPSRLPIFQPAQATNLYHYYFDGRLVVCGDFVFQVLPWRTL